MLGSKSDAGLEPVKEAPPRHATWLTASQLIIADVIGIGVMAMAEAFAQLGWVLGVSLCLLLLPLNLYSGLMVWEVIVDVYPDSLSLADLAFFSMGRAMYYVTALLVYSFIFMTLGDYLLSLGLCLQMLFPDASLPTLVWTLLAGAVLLPFCQVRTLNAAGVLLWINSATIVLSVGLCLGYLISEGPEASLARSGGHTHLVAEGLNWQSFTSGASKIAFAYVGVLMYPEIIVEMAEPRDFPKAFFAGAPFQLGAFMTVGCVGYGYLGDKAHSLLINAVPPGVISRTCALSLFVHLVITYLIKGTVLTRYLHRYLHPATVNDRGAKGTLVWLGLTSALMLVCLLVASAVPFFDDLTSLIGSLQTPIVGFCLPVLFYIAGRRAAGRSFRWWLYALLSLIFIFGAVFCVLGTTATVTSIATRWEEEPPQASALHNASSNATQGDGRRFASATRAAASAYNDEERLTPTHLYSSRLQHTADCWRQGNCWHGNASSHVEAARAVVEQRGAAMVSSARLLAPRQRGAPSASHQPGAGALVPELVPSGVYMSVDVF